MPFACGDLGHDLLREHVERLLGDRQAVEFAAGDGIEQRRALDEVVTRQREQPSLRRAFDRVPRAPDPLQETRDRARRSELADQVDLADVDAELERGGRDQRLQRTAFQTLLGIQPQLLGEAAVVRAHLALAQALRQCARHPLGHPARVDEDQGGAVRLDQLRQTVVDLLPDVRGHHGFERGGWNFEGEVTCAPMAGVDDRAFAGRLGLRARPDQKARDRLDRLLGRRKAHPQQFAAAELRQALERQRQVGAALVRRDGVNFVDDHRARGPEHAAAGLGAEQDVERLRRGHDDVRRAAAHALALGRWRVAGPHQGADVHVRQALGPQSLADPGERCFEVALDVVGERLQRRDVDDLGLVPEPAVQSLPHEGIDRREKGGERLAGSGRSRDQRMPARLDRGPRVRLRRGRRSEVTLEPGGDRRVKQGGCVHVLVPVPTGEFIIAPLPMAPAHILPAYGSGFVGE